MLTKRQSTTNLLLLIGVTYLLSQCQFERVRLLVSPISLGTIKPIPVKLRLPLSLPLPVTVLPILVTVRKKRTTLNRTARVAAQPAVRIDRRGGTRPTQPTGSGHLLLTGRNPNVFVTTYKASGYLGGPLTNASTDKLPIKPSKYGIPQSMTTTYPTKGYLDTDAFAINQVPAQRIEPQPIPSFLLASDWAHCLAKQASFSPINLQQLLKDTATHQQPVPGDYGLVAAFLQPGLPIRQPVNADTRARVFNSHLPIQPTQLPRHYALFADASSSTSINRPNQPQPPIAKKGASSSANHRPGKTSVRQAAPQQQKKSVTSAALTPPPAIASPVRQSPPTCTELLQRFIDVGGCSGFYLHIDPDMTVRVQGCHATMAYLLMGTATSSLTIKSTGAYQSQTEQGQTRQLPIGIWQHGDSLWLCRPTQIGLSQHTILTLFIRRTPGPQYVATQRHNSLWRRLTGWLRKPIGQGD